MRLPHTVALSVLCAALQQGASCSGQGTQSPILCPAGPRKLCEASQGLLHQGLPRGQLLWRSCYLSWAPLQGVEARPLSLGPQPLSFPLSPLSSVLLLLLRCFPKPSSVPRVPSGLLKIKFVMPQREENAFVSSFALSHPPHEVTGSERPGCLRRGGGYGWGEEGSS